MDIKSRDVVEDVAPVGSGGERRSSTLPTGEAIGPLAPGQRWSLARKREVALCLLRGEPVELLSRELNVPVWMLEGWRDKALAGIDSGLRERGDDPLERDLAEAHRRIGSLSMENELLRGRIGRSGPLGGRRSR